MSTLLLDGKKKSPRVHRVMEDGKPTGERLVTGQPLEDREDAKGLPSGARTLVLDEAEEISTPVPVDEKDISEF